MTLRQFTLGLGVLLLAAGLAAAVFGQIFAIHLLAAGGLLTLGTAFEAWRYKPTLPRPPSSGARATGERFVDPGTGEWVEVYFDPASGERSYVRVPR